MTEPAAPLSDLLDRLRIIADTTLNGGFPGSNRRQEQADVREAAIEIDRLRTALAGERAAAIEEAAALFEPNCSCTHPCDDWLVWPSPCAKLAASKIRALRALPAASAGVVVPVKPSREVIGHIVDKAFGGGIEDQQVIYDIYAAIVDFHQNQSAGGAG